MASGAGSGSSSATRGQASPTSSGPSPTASRPVPVWGSDCPARAGSWTSSTWRRRSARARWSPRPSGSADVVTPRELVGGEDGTWLAVHDASAAGGVRRVAVSMGQAAGLPVSALGDLAIVATEVGTNLARHAVEGRVLVRTRRVDGAVGIELV